MTITTLKNDIKNLKSSLNTRLPEETKAKIRVQISKSEKMLAEMESAKTPTAKKNATKKSTSVLQKIKQANKKTEPKKPSVLQSLKNKVKLTKNLSGYKKSGIDLVRDADRPALPAGKRISKDGNVYYENRLNRVDVKQPPKRYPKLEDGGIMAKGGGSEVHRAYAKGGVLQHGLEKGDFIVSHDEGKMIIMNGGNKYEVNIHSGSRTKID